MIRSYSAMTAVAAIVVLLPLPPLRLDFCFPDKASFLLETPLFPLCYSVWFGYSSLACPAERPLIPLLEAEEEHLCLRSKWEKTYLTGEK